MRKKIKNFSMIFRYKKYNKSYSRYNSRAAVSVKKSNGTISNLFEKLTEVFEKSNDN